MAADCPSQHYNDVIMSAMASQINSLTIVYSTVYSGTYQRKHQSSASLAFVRGNHRGPVNSPHKWPVTRKMFPFLWRHHGVTTRRLWTKYSQHARVNHNAEFCIQYISIISENFPVSSYKSTWYFTEPVKIYQPHKSTRFMPPSKIFLTCGQQCRPGSTLAHVTACCLTAPSHYRDQCWLVISMVQWHSSKGNVTQDASVINH